MRLRSYAVAVQEGVERTQNTAATTIQHVAVMPQELLHCPYIVARLQQVRGEAVTKAVVCCGFGNPTAPDGLLHCFCTTDSCK